MAELNISLLKMAERYEPIDNQMTVPTAVGPGQINKNSIRGRTFHTLVVSGITTATLQPMASLDNVAFFAVGSPITANGVYTLNGSYQFLRIDTTAYTSGTPVVTVRSQNA